MVAEVRVKVESPSHDNRSCVNVGIVASNEADDLPDDFLEPLDSPLASSPRSIMHLDTQSPLITSKDVDKAMFRQFWKAGQYESAPVKEDVDIASCVEHIRVHPKFLHSNATSHKWALGAIAELLDNALDEVVNGASFVRVDMVRNPRDGCPMLIIEDDGGGMGPERIRQCMSLGYSAKSQIKNTIGQYGNGFKTSTMRLGADVLVLSRTKNKSGSLPTQSLGLLSYTFLMATGQDDIVVPMVDFEIQPFGLKKLVRGTLDDWNKNLETLLQWSPYDTQQGLFDQLERIKGQGTIIMVYNLWQNDEGEYELDFDADPEDIQLRGANRDEKSISMAVKYPHCRHFFAHKYSLRSYASILYLRLPKNFTVILRGKQVIHHKLASDLMLVEQVKYKPAKASAVSPRDATTTVTLGFVKEAKEHVNVQGFSIYHKNRLIKPFWRGLNTASVHGRGIFGILEANFVEPAHDKQGFERTSVFARLEAKLIEIQKNYWARNCGEIGYKNVSKKRDSSQAEIVNVGLSLLNKASKIDNNHILINCSNAEQLILSTPKGISPSHHGSTSSESVPLEELTMQSNLESRGLRRSERLKMNLHQTEPQKIEGTSEGQLGLVVEALSRNHNDSASHSAAGSLPGSREVVKNISSGNIQVDKGINQTVEVKCATSDLDSDDSQVGSKQTRYNVRRSDDGGQFYDASRFDEPLITSSKKDKLALDVIEPSLQASLMSESLQDSNEGLVSPSSHCDRPESSQCTSEIAVKINSSRGWPHIRTRSLMQLQQSQAKAGRLDASGSQQAQQLMENDTMDANHLIEPKVEDGEPSIMTMDTPISESVISLESVNMLESKVNDMKQQLRSIQSELGKLYKEIDFLKGDLVEEKKRRLLVEGELKKRLEALSSRAAELEAANTLMQVCQK
ncbi:hypothetical protein KP509_10G043700 [Ceratopteris richardii]|nr:hypothetical protein KP509_10G043700 [Ceratopteris richardii]